MQMENIILQTNNLTKKFGSFTALDNVNITLYEKHIYAFIGENGAGKTTVMRILTGLLFSSSGSFSLFGKSKPHELENMRKYIGSTIETPALYHNYTAYQNLELQRILIGNPDKSICDKTLKLVDLYDVRKKRVSTFSMGMKQRLSIALALIGKPRLLILDEPINGLDPRNIADLRNTLKKLNEEERTVSSCHRLYYYS
jgi:ABC-2 type transport system ATP-binding protein